MTTSLRWGLGVLASIGLQLGCASIHVDYEPHQLSMPTCYEDSCNAGETCRAQGSCGINGISHVGRSLVSLQHRATCGLRCTSGCGEVYWDEHINEPPVCDPCGCDNVWTGLQGECRPWYSRMRDWWGYRYPGSYDCQCGQCGPSLSASGDHSTLMYSDGNHYEVEHVQPDVHGTSEMSAAPIPLNQQPTPAKPKNEPRLLPGDIIEPSPPSILEGESSGGKSAQSRKPTKLEVTSFAQAPKKLAEAPKKVSAQSASGRRKLTTHRR